MISSKVFKLTDSAVEDIKMSVHLDTEQYIQKSTDNYIPSTLGIKKPIVADRV